MKRILLVIPSIDGKITCDTFHSLWQLAKAPDVDFAWGPMIWGQDVVRTRNRAVQVFLESPADILWFVDADVGFSPDVPKALASAPLMLVGGAYPKKRIHWAAQSREEMLDWSFLPDPAVGHEDINGRAFQRCQGIPMGCTMIRREVFDQVRSKVELKTYVDKYDGALHEVTDYFGLMHHGNSMLPEDYSFCVRARMAGIQPWVLLDPICTHTGSMRFDAREIRR